MCRALKVTTVKSIEAKELARSIITYLALHHLDPHDLVQVQVGLEGLVVRGAGRVLPWWCVWGWVGWVNGGARPGDTFEGDDRTTRTTSGQGCGAQQRPYRGAARCSGRLRRSPHTPGWRRRPPPQSCADMCMKGFGLVCVAPPARCHFNPVHAPDGPQEGGVLQKPLEALLARQRSNLCVCVGDVRRRISSLASLSSTTKPKNVCVHLRRPPPPPTLAAGPVAAAGARRRAGGSRGRGGRCRA